MNDETLRHRDVPVIVARDFAIAAPRADER
jgi:hypothetical protein